MSGDRSRIDRCWNRGRKDCKMSIPLILKEYRKAHVFTPAMVLRMWNLIQLLFLPQALTNFRYVSQASRKVSLPGSMPFLGGIGIQRWGEVRLADPVKAVSLRRKKGRIAWAREGRMPEPIFQCWKHLPGRKQAWFLILSPKLVYVFYTEYSLGKMLRYGYQFVILME